MSVDGRGASGWRKTGPNGLPNTLKSPKSDCQTAVEGKLFLWRDLGRVGADLNVIWAMSDYR